MFILYCILFMLCSRLKAWENEINSIESATVRVTNEYDLEGPPRHMTYVTKYQVM